MQQIFFYFQIREIHSFKYDWGKTNIWIRVSWSCLSTASLKNPFLNRLCEIMKNHVFQKVIVINALYSDMKYCVDWKSEGATKHMSSQGMLEQLVNSIIEGPLNKSCKTIDRSFFQISKFHSCKCNKRNNKDLNQGGLELLVNCITEGSLPQEAVQNAEISCFSKIHHDQYIQTWNFLSITNLKVPISIWAVKVCWNSSSTASLKDVSTTHVELCEVEVI